MVCASDGGDLQIERAYHAALHFKVMPNLRKGGGGEFIEGKTTIGSQCAINPLLTSERFVIFTRAVEQFSKHWRTDKDL